MPRRSKQWTVATAKAQLSEVIERALADGPQVVTRHGVETVVIVSVEEWERKSKRSGSLAEFLASSPLRDSDVVIERSKDGPRQADR